ncbi:MAG TPA: MFS transporter [Candidatus Marinimicrobia bacterium]|uniref:Major facilitator superfamily (MFS) profile domain-containing protein n=1 Tax=marine metagenome TaxID=408172 RepID=A0A381XEW2_9ZZZZ|nr:MFS transporter [Candidatus Neomarinimicrobiota bacterium]
MEKRKEIWSWCFYDFGNSAFTTLVITFIYSTYFTKAIAENEIDGTYLWSQAIAITAVIVSLLSPILGAIADKGGYRKIFLTLTTYMSIGATALLFFPIKGQILFALILVVIANVNFELGGVFYNAYLPEIVSRKKIGRISGIGWGAGYLGGLLAMLVAMVGFVSPDVPWFGLDIDTGEHIRATNVLVAAWFFIFTLPAILYLKEKKVESANRIGIVVLNSIQALKKTFQEIKIYKNTVRFLISRLIYNDGLVTIFAFGAIYASGTFGFTFNEIMIFGIVLNIAAGSGAFLMGYIDDVIGGKLTIQISLIGLMIAVLLAVFANSKLLFWVSGIIVGLFAGPNQSASRSLMGRLTPPDKINEFYGFFAFSGKLTSFLGPMLLGIFTKYFSSQRYGVAVVFIFFFVGFLLMRNVNEPDADPI